MFLAVLVLSIQIAIVTFIAYATGNTKQITDTLWMAKVNLVYHLLAVKSIAEDLYYRNNQKDINSSDKNGQVAIVTGGGKGIGFYIAKDLVKRGMHVVIAVRDVEKYNHVIADFKKYAMAGEAEVMHLDTSSMQSVKDFAARVKAKHDKINVLVNNAGVIFGEFEESVDGFELKLATNYLGHFLLCHLLVDCLEKGARDAGEYSRIVNVSSSAHGSTGINFEDIHMKKNYVRLAAYSQSKLAQLMFSRHLNRLLASKRVPVRSSALHPGVVASSMARDWTSWALVGRAFKTEEQGAASALYCALERTLETDGADFVSNMRTSWSSAASRNEADQRKLFEMTCEMLNIESFGSKF